MKKSIYAYAAEAGIPVGIYLTAMSWLLLTSVNNPDPLRYLLPLVILFPVLIGGIQWKIAKAEPAYCKISPLWLLGIYAVIFGSLICALLSGLYLVFLEPGFVTRYVLSSIQAIEESPLRAQYAQTTEVLREAIEARILPSSMQFVATMGWFTCFAGSILSLLSALVITTLRRRKTVIPD